MLVQRVRIRTLLSTHTRRTSAEKKMGERMEGLVQPSTSQESALDSGAALPPRKMMNTAWRVSKRERTEWSWEEEDEIIILLSHEVTISAFKPIELMERPLTISADTRRWYPREKTSTMEFSRAGVSKNKQTLALSAAIGRSYATTANTNHIPNHILAPKLARQ